ncbi:MAG: BatD family protein [Bacteroidales bacterium]|nr:BatD family protein [Bacteroidales bacterium]
MKRFSILFILFHLFVFGAFAQDITITVSAPKIVEEGGLFHIRYSINTEPGNMFSIETCNEIQASGRPQTGSSSSISIVNGQMSKSYTYTETRQFRALKKGTYPIPVASVKIDGKTYKSKAQTVEVVDRSSGVASQNNQQSSSNTYSGGQSVPTDEPKPASASDEVFARIFVNKTSAYIGEPILATIKLYTQKDITNLENYTFPDFNGFYKRVLEQPQKLEYKEETIDGKQYYSILFQRIVIFPQKEGKMTISPFKVSCDIVSGYVSTGFWGFGQRKIERRNVESKPVTITVKPFPAGKDASYTGAVGKMSVSSSTDVTSIPANEAFAFKVVVKGEGNLSLLPKPVITFPQDFEVYDPKVTDNFSITSTGDKGSKTFEYVVIPRHEGNFEIPSVKMQVFNPETKTYTMLSTEPIAITVTKGTSSGGVVSNYSSVTKEDVQFGNDIQFIKTGDLQLEEKHSYFFKSLFYWLLVVLSLLATIIVILLKRRQITMQSDVSLMKNKRANKESQKRLKTARKYLDENNTTLFYEEIAKALWGYVGDKFSLEQIDLTTDKIKETLVQKGIEDSIIEELIQVIHQCEFARFAPSSSAEGREQLYLQAAEVIQKFEQKKK